MELLRIVSKQVKAGSPLPFNVRDESGNLLLACGQVVSSERQLEELLARGMYADMEEIKALAANRKVEPKVAPTLFTRWRHAVWELDALLKSLAEPDFPARCGEFAHKVMALVQQDADVAIYLSVRQEEHKPVTYGLTHALHAAALCQLIGYRIEWPTEKVLSAVQAALTMNLAVVMLQGSYAVQGRMSEHQMDELRQHPHEAEARLRAAGVVDAEWLQAVAQHHEHPDGKGYPLGLTEVSELAQLLRLVDVFLAKICSRQSRPAQHSSEAVRQAFADSPGSAMATALIKEYGIYPPGELVSLASGEKGVVIRRGATMQTPVVATLTDKKGLPVSSTNRRDTALVGFGVSGMEADKSLVADLLPERAYGVTG